MSNRIVTYFSKNSKPEHQWMGFVETIDGRLGIWFPASTEEEAKSKVKAFWAREKAKRPTARAKAVPRRNAAAGAGAEVAA